MSFDIETWRSRAEANLRGWTDRLAGSRLDSALAFLGAVVLWPLVEAARGGEWSAPLLLHKVLPAEEASRLVEDMAGWQDETQGARRLQDHLQDTPWAPKALTALLDRLDLLPQAVAAAASERAALASRLRQELKGYGAPSRLVQALEVSGKNGDARGSPLERVAEALVGPAPADRDARAEYRSWWLSRSAAAGLAAHLTPPGHTGPSPDLGQVFVSPATRTWISRQTLATALREGRLPFWGETSGRGRARFLGVQEPRRLVSPLERLPALAAAGFVPHLVLLGPAGSGKTTLLRYLTHRLAASGLHPEEEPDPRLPGWPPSDRRRLPVFLPLRHLTVFLARHASEGPSAALMLRALEQGLSAMGAPVEAAQGALEEGQAMLLLDGLEEVPFPEPRALLVETLAAFLEAYPENRCLVTCRPEAYQDPAAQVPDLPVFDLAPPNEREAARLLQRLLAVWGERSSAREQTEALLADLSATSLLPGPWSPLDLTLIARLSVGGESPPENRGRLYERAAEYLLWGPAGGPTAAVRGILAEKGLTPMDLRHRLWQQAFHQAQGDAFQPGRSPAQALRSELLSLGREDPAWAEEMLAALQEAGSPLATDQTDAFDPPDGPLRHVLAGAHLACQGTFVREAAQAALRGPAAQEAVRLGALRLADVLGEADRPMELAARLLEQENEAATVLATEVLNLLGPAVLRAGPQGEATLARAREALAQALDRPDLHARQRARRGNLLATLGDPRPGLDPSLSSLGAMPFCFVPAGPFWMGSTPADQPAAEEDELGHEAPLDLPYAYWISRYPVTVGQWRFYLQATGLSPTDPESAAGLSNHPATWVTWQEAQAFCRWLNERFHDRLPPGYAFQLPSEAEWEKAARGGLQIPEEPLVRPLARGLPPDPPGVSLVENPLPRRRYPWGEDLEPDRANYAGAGIGGTCAVGSFPTGRSPLGVEDLAGNVWEWTRSLYRPYPYDPQDGREAAQVRGDVRRVLRGGAFPSLPLDLRCATRLPDEPAFWVRPCGFRVVVAPR